MSTTRRSLVTNMAGLTALSAIGLGRPAFAATPDSDPEADQAASTALQKLISENDAARAINEKSFAALVFPKIVKVGFLLGGAYGEGVLLHNQRSLGYYNSAAASYGLQAGVQWFGYVLFFMNQKSLDYLDSSNGFEIGLGPSVVVVDAGMAKKFSSTTITQDVYAFIFNQNGLMAGLGLEGSKITKV